MLNSFKEMYTHIRIFDTWRRHLMETFSALLALWAGNSPVTGEFPSQRPVTRSFDVFFFFICAWTNDWENNRDAGNFRRHSAHCDVTIMFSWQWDKARSGIFLVEVRDSGHNGHKPKRPKSKRPQTGTATNRNDNKPKRPQTETATNRNGHK